jgi:hypothetical protein
MGRGKKGGGWGAVRAYSGTEQSAGGHVFVCWCAGGRNLLLKKRLHDGEGDGVHGLTARSKRRIAHVGVHDLQLRGAGKGVAAVAQGVQKATQRPQVGCRAGKCLFG